MEEQEACLDCKLAVGDVVQNQDRGRAEPPVASLAVDKILSVEIKIAMISQKKKTTIYHTCWRLLLDRKLLLCLFELYPILLAKLHPSLSVDQDFQSWIQGRHQDHCGVVAAAPPDSAASPGHVVKVIVPLDEDAPGLELSVELLDHVLQLGLPLVGTIHGRADRAEWQAKVVEETGDHWHSGFMKNISTFFHEIFEFIFNSQTGHLCRKKWHFFELWLWHEKSILLFNLMLQQDRFYLVSWTANGVATLAGCHVKFEDMD